MKLFFAALRGRTFLETFGLLSLIVLLACVAFHFELGKIYPFYRELFGILFGVLWLWLLLSTKPTYANSSLRIHTAMFYLVLFPVLLMIWSVVDPGIPLYGATVFEEVSENVSASTAKLYVLRNALLYLPMVLYFSRRGLNEKELQLIALAAVLIAPLSVAAYLESGGLATLATMYMLAESGHSGIAYNSYVPFLTFPVMCGLYLLFSRFGLLFKSIVLLCVFITTLFIVLSTSRQSVLFIILVIVALYYFSPKKIHGVGLIKLAVLGGITAFIFLIFMGDAHFGDSFYDRFSSLEGGANVNRMEVWLQGMRMLEPGQWIMGAGLTSIINSGPHNDYIRWTQRVGVVVMLIGFVPFFIAFWKTFKLARKAKDGNLIYAFLCLGIGFTLFHSFFGYPREDAFQAPYVYLGLALWFGALRQGLLNPPGNQKVISRPVPPQGVSDIPCDSPPRHL